MKFYCGKFLETHTNYLFYDLGIFKYIYEIKLLHHHSCELVSIFCKVIKDYDSEQCIESGVFAAIYDAVNRGHVEFLFGVAKENGVLLRLLIGENERTHLMRTVLARQEKVFCLLKELGALGQITMGASQKDKFGGTVLHMAGELAPSSQLNCIPGAALQMQRELQWFKVHFSYFPKN